MILKTPVECPSQLKEEVGPFGFLCLVPVQIGSDVSRHQIAALLQGLLFRAF